MENHPGRNQKRNSKLLRLHNLHRIKMFCKLQHFNQYRCPTLNVPCKISFAVCPLHEDCVSFQNALAYFIKYAHKRFHYEINPSLEKNS